MICISDAVCNITSIQKMAAMSKAGNVEFETHRLKWFNSHLRIATFKCRDVCLSLRDSEACHMPFYVWNGWTKVTNPMTLND